jgi:hypothetical protein
VSVWVVPAGLRAMLRSYKNSHMSSLKPSIKVPVGPALARIAGVASSRKGSVG